MEDRFQKLISLVREKNLKLDIALMFGKIEMFREILIKLIEENKVDIVKNLEKIIDVERKYIYLSILFDTLSPLAFQIGRELYDEVRKIKSLYDIRLYKLFFSLLDENVEEINKNVNELIKLEKNIEELVSKISEKINL